MLEIIVYLYHRDRLVLSGCLIVNDKEEILLLYRKKHNHYETPGGKVDLEDYENPNETTKNVEKYLISPD